MSKQPNSLTTLHNALLNPGTLLASVVSIAFGFILLGLGDVHYASFNAFVLSGGIAVAFAGGLALSFGFVLLFSQQYFAFAVFNAVKEISIVAIAAILTTVGQFLIGFGSTLGGTANIYGIIVTIAGYAFIGVAFLITGQTGVTISALKPTASSPTSPS